jgi:AraC-like DNA-binding protein
VKPELRQHSMRSALQMIRVLLVACCMFGSCHVAAQVTLVIDQLPGATPVSDTLYVSGTFNDWALRDPRYILQRRIDGKLAVTIPSDRGVIQYKFHRGSWAKVETNARNEYIPNRVLTGSHDQTVHVSIHNWQDVGGAKSFDFSVFYFFATACLAALAITFIYIIKNRRRKDSLSLQYLLAFIAIVLLARVLFEISNIAWQYYYAMAGEVALFISGLCWYFAMCPEKAERKNVWLHFIPVGGIAALVLLKIASVSALNFLTIRVINNVIDWNTFLFFGLALVSNIIYFVAGLISYQDKKKSGAEQPPLLRFKKYLLVAGGAFVIILIVKATLLLSAHESILFWVDRDLIFVFASLPVMITSYYVFRYEELLRILPVTLRSEELEPLKTLVDQVMKEKKAFKDPHLTLNEFAAMVNVKPHLLSKVINESYHQNFRDFVNRYRVEEFIAIARQDNNKRFTFLALANEVGFNSKSTFNAAFKKVTQRSPREFFKSSKVIADLDSE